MSAIPDAQAVDAMNEQFNSEYKRNSLLIEKNDARISDLVAEEESNEKLEAENVIISERNAWSEKTFNEKRKEKQDA